VGSAGAFLTSAVTSITGTANEITVTGTTTPTLSLPSALTLTGKTVTGGTFNSPTLFEPSSINYKILDTQDGTMKGRLTNDFTHVYLDSGGDVFLRSTDFVSSYLILAHFSASTGRMSLGYPAFLSGKIGFKNATSTGTTTLDSANASANDYTATLQAATGTLALTSDITGGTRAGSFTTLTASATTSLLLGTAGSAVGNIGFRNATSGTTTLAPAAGALGTGTVTLPLSGTLAISSGAQTFTGVQSMTSPDITTSITTPSTTFALVNATATTVNFAGAATTLLIAAAATAGSITLGKAADATGTVTVNNTTPITATATGALLVQGGAYFAGGATCNGLIFGYGGSTVMNTWSGGAINVTPSLQINKSTDSTSLSTGALIVAGGAAITKSVIMGGTLAVTGATTLTGNLTSNGAYISTPQALSGNGAVAAVNLTTLTTTIANTGTANTTTTLAAGTNGQTKIISFITDGGFDAVVTVTNPAWGGAGTITMNDALDNIMLIYLNSVWQVFINNGCTLA
jgi:hypothetical protein